MKEEILSRILSYFYLDESRQEEELLEKLLPGGSFSVLACRGKPKVVQRRVGRRREVPDGIVTRVFVAIQAG